MRLTVSQTNWLTVGLILFWRGILFLMTFWTSIFLPTVACVYMYWNLGDSVMAILCWAGHVQNARTWFVGCCASIPGGESRCRKSCRTGGWDWRATTPSSSDWCPTPWTLSTKTSNLTSLFSSTCASSASTRIKYRRYVLVVCATLWQGHIQELMEGVSTFLLSPPLPFHPPSLPFLSLSSHNNTLLVLVFTAYSQPEYQCSFSHCMRCVCFRASEVVVLTTLVQYTFCCLTAGNDTIHTRPIPAVLRHSRR